MKVRNKDLLTVFVAVAGCTALFLALTCYRHGPWRGKVIDAETGEPIEGAAVVAVWGYYHIAPTGRATRFLDAEEAVTDKNGEFTIPAKWYLQVKYLRTMEEWRPTFTIYKPGFGTFPGFQINPLEHPSSVFENKGATIELPELTTEDERMSAASAAHVDAPWGYTPELLKLINKERNEFGYNPIGTMGVKE